MNSGLATNERIKALEADVKTLINELKNLKSSLGVENDSPTEYIVETDDYNKKFKNVIVGYEPLPGESWKYTFAIDDSVRKPIYGDL